MSSRRFRAVSLTFACWLAAPACAQLDATQLESLIDLAGLGSGQPLSEQTIASGLREALSVGTERTVSETSRRDGFYGNPRLRIPLPESLTQASSAFRAIGMGSLVDDFELRINRAAERAAAEATPVFLDALRQMTIQDARSILSGNERAATDYFEARTRAPLADRFSPIVRAGVREVGLAAAYQDFLAQLKRLPLLPKPSLDLDDYVTQRALDGLFLTLAGEEAKIRRDPAARTTELLRRVFGSVATGVR